MTTAPTVVSCKLNTASGTVRRLEKLEASFVLDRAWDNPYDPDTVLIDAIVTCPDGTEAKTPCFWYEGYSRRLSRGEELLEPDGASCWKLRYTPRQLGPHAFRIEIRVDGRISHYPPQGSVPFVCVPSAERGFLRVSARNSAYLEYEDGAPYLGIGHNLCGWEWGGTDNRSGTFEYDEWLSGLARNGATMAQFDFCEGDQLEWTPHPDELPFSADWRGLVRYNQQNAWKMDHRIQRAEELGLFFRLSLLHWEDFDDETEDFPDWGWNRNPYNRANGGPVADVSQFFRRAEARRIYRKQLRYIVARWGYSKNILAYELWNEVDAEAIIWGGERPDYAANAEAVADWHREMAGYLKAVDPNRALVTTSCAHSYNGGELWRLDDIDLTTFHRYTYFNPDYGDRQYDTVGTLRKLLTERFADTGKPVLAGEFALSPGGDIQKDFDVAAVEFHKQLWSSVMAGSLGTAMHWTWGSYLHEHGLYGHYKPLAAFFADEDLRELRPFAGPAERTDGSGDGSLSVMGLAGPARALAWVADSRVDFRTAQRAETTETAENAALRIGGLADGLYDAACYDTRTGRKLADSRALAAEDGTLVVALPAFRFDLAVKIVRSEENGPDFASLDIPLNQIGSATERTGKRVVLTAGGSGIGGETDAFRFVRTAARGDFALTARIDALTNLGEQVKAGLMLRQDETDDAPFAFVGIDPRGYARFGCRTRRGGTAVFTAGVPAGLYAWFKLERTGDEVAGYVSPDRDAWERLGAVSAAELAGEAPVGMAACSKDAITYVRAAFYDVRLSGR